MFLGVRVGVVKNVIFDVDIALFLHRFEIPFASTFLSSAAPYGDFQARLNKMREEIRFKNNRSF